MRVCVFNCKNILVAKNKTHTRVELVEFKGYKIEVTIRQRHRGKKKIQNHFSIQRLKKNPILHVGVSLTLTFDACASFHVHQARVYIYIHDIHMNINILRNCSRERERPTFLFAELDSIQNYNITIVYRLYSRISFI